MLRPCRLDHLSVCPQSILWQNGWMDPDAVWDGEWGHPGIHVCAHVPMGVHVPQGEGAVLGDYRHLRPHWFEWAEWRIIRTEMYSTCTRKVNNISIRTIHHWNLRFIGFPRMYSSSRSMLGFESNWRKCNSWHMQTEHSAARWSAVATSRRPSASRPTLIFSIRH